MLCKSLSFRICFYSVLFFGFHSVLGAEKQKPLELLNADFSELRIEDNNTILNLIGNVRFRHEDANLKSNRAVWYRNSGQIILIDDVRVEDMEHILSADRLTYFQKNKKIVADGKVVLVNKTDNSSLTGEHGEYDRQAKYARFTIQPRLVSDYTKGDSALTVTSRIMEYSVDDRKGIASGNVEIDRGNMKAFCDTAIYLKLEDKLILKGNPRAEQDGSELSGNEMEIALRESQIKVLTVRGNAKATYRGVSDSASGVYEESFLAGKSIAFFLEKQKLKEVEVVGNATSLYYPSRTDTLHRGKNEASGDTITLFLENDEVKRVQIKGGAMGVYYNLKKAQGDTLLREDTIKYSAQSIDYITDEETITLERNSYLEYGQTSLSAGRVKYFARREVLKAEGMPAVKDSLETVEGLPVLKDGKDEIYGQSMAYDLMTRRGRIEVGKTQFNKGTFTGEEIRKVENEVLFVGKGIYTTCDLEKPHYHFEGRRMKILVDDKVIVQPLVFYLADMPVLWIPFYVFPIKPGRHSGFTIFDLGNLESSQRFIRNFGYYWAASDYWDLKTTLDYFEGKGWILHGQGRYSLRYLLNGNLGGSYTKESSWSGYAQRKRTRWDLSFNHYHTLGPFTRLSGSGTFISDKDYYRDISLNGEERRNRSLDSKVSLSTRWSEFSTTVAISRNLNLDTDAQTDLFPAMSLSKPSLPLFKSTEGKSKATSKSWYQAIYYSYSSDLQNHSSRSRLYDEFEWKKYITFDHHFNLQSPQAIFGWFVLNPLLNYQETWYYVLPTNVSQESNMPSETVARRGTYSTSISAKTDIYGTFYPHLAGMTGLRHIATPVLSFTYQPRYTYHDQYKSYTGVGGGSGAKSQNLTFGLNNLFQMKYGPKEKEKKIDLFNLSLSSGYNFVEREHKLFNLSSSFRSSAIRNIDFDMHAVHDFYDEKTKVLKVFSPRLVSFDLNTTFSISGKRVGSREYAIDTSAVVLREDLLPTTQVSSRSWSLRLTHRYSQTKALGTKSQNHWAEASLGLPLTAHWFLNYVNRYDFQDKKITSQSFELYRDMHCWEGKFVWIVNGFRRGYYFKFNIKLLPEVKIEKSEKGLKEIFL